MKKIIYLLDNSGSMKEISDKLLISINKSIDDFKKISNLSIEIITFNHEINVLLPLVNINEISYIKEYKTGGRTALNDAVAFVIDRYTNDNNITVIIVTDGEENSSKKYAWYRDGQEKIENMVNKKIDIGWKFIYLSSNLQKQGERLGIINKYNYNCENNNNIPIFLNNQIRDNIL